MDSDLQHLLTMAAKAAGLEFHGDNSNGTGGRWIKCASIHGVYPSNYRSWAPHTDDGDSRRLQVACRISLVPFDDAMAAMHNESGRSWAERHDAHSGDSCAAARLAVLRAAAAIGEAMP